ncbi:nuclear transport factor 2 family protein [Rhizobium sp. DKSPLA3]|uniref:Nuclear transport factor 2 family protein n=1 Tax=Rhizobium quercicola TaxID=2901226 RepID=A0A9X1NYN2_9HYPH|nr:nuclear transport factor 2 family protein [Rhizobium quercicola]MCD7111678.1 nuclear transport factor 2 family protein [Rhizobium quercicola]
MTALADTFIAALHRLESDRDTDTIAGLFAEDASLSSPLVSYEEGGAAAAKTFWSHYRDAFEEIVSEFRAVRETDGVAFLEWRSRGRVAGVAFDYGGVSVLEEADGKIASFRTYFDSARIPRAHATDAHSTGAPATGAHVKGGDDRTARAEPEIEQTGKNNREDDLDTAQRDAAEQRAKGGYS